MKKHVQYWELNILNYVNDDFILEVYEFGWILYLLSNSYSVIDFLKITIWLKFDN